MEGFVRVYILKVHLMIVYYVLLFIIYKIMLLIGIREIDWDKLSDLNASKDILKKLRELNGEPIKSAN